MRAVWFDFCRMLKAHNRFTKTHSVAKATSQPCILLVITALIMSARPGKECRYRHESTVISPCLVMPKNNEHASRKRKAEKVMKRHKLCINFSHFFYFIKKQFPMQGTSWNLGASSQELMCIFPPSNHRPSEARIERYTHTMTPLCQPCR